MKKRLPALLFVTIGVLSTAFVYTNREFEITKNLEIFANIYRELNTNYVDDIAPGVLMKTGIDAMVQSLDPYTVYWSESQIEGYRYLTKGKYEGIGAVIKLIDDYPTIVESFEKSPATESGLRIGDQILQVDGQDAKGRSSEDLRAVMRGVPGTTMTLLIKRPGEKKPQTIKVTRGEISVPNVPYSGIIRNHIGYISLTTFTPKAGNNVVKALRNLYTEDPDLQGVILDLRDNGGGLLREAVNVCNIFIDKDQEVVSTRSKVKTRDRFFKTTRPAEDKNIRVAVLINERSASASEIVSGVLQDLDRAVLIGQKSFGKGLVQNTFDVGYNAKVKITTSKYYIPSGRCIQGKHYENGKAVDIPDDQRQRFKTKNGRTVLDGGGIKPDLIIQKQIDEKLLEALQEKQLIFKYVTQFSKSINKTPEPGSYTFQDWNDFVNFLQSNDFHYKSPLETEIEQLKKLTQKEETSPQIKQTVQQLEKLIKDSKTNILNSHKETIIRMIEQEIISRYHYRKGKTIHAIRGDQEVDKAIEILTDEARYTNILKP